MRLYQFDCYVTYFGLPVHGVDYGVCFDNSPSTASLHDTVLSSDSSPTPAA